MFLYNRGYFSGIEGVNPSGVVLCTSSLDYQRLLNKNDKYNVEMILQDPQIYLWSIDKCECPSTYNKIISYPWVKTIKPKTLSIKKISMPVVPTANQVSSIVALKTDEEILNCLKLCFDIQKKFGVTHLIIPTPLAIAREDQFSEQLRWLQLAASFKEEYDVPFLATIALSDETLLNCTFEENFMLQTILDNAAVMEHIDGYYIVVERDASTIQITEINIARALLELVYNLGYCQGKEVVVNFTDVFGLVCMAAGATAFGSGYNTKERRLSFNDFIERGGGMSLPRYYSSSLMGDFYSERDLKKIIDLKLRRYILDDIVTSHSTALINALKKQIPLGSIQAWKESRSNTAAAAKHRVDCIADQSNKIAQYDTIEEKLELIFTWIQDAEAKMEYLKTRLKNDPLNEDGRHLSVWRKALEDFMRSNSINL